MFRGGKWQHCFNCQTRAQCGCQSEVPGLVLLSKAAQEERKEKEAQRLFQKCQQNGLFKHSQGWEDLG